MWTVSGAGLSGVVSRADYTDSTTELLDQPFASSEMGRRLITGAVRGNVGGSYLSGRTYSGFAATDSDLDFIVASRRDETLTTVRQWVQTGAPPAWPECSALSPELRCWRLQFGNLSVNTEGRLWRRRAPPAMSSQLVVSGSACSGTSGSDSSIS